MVFELGLGNRFYKQFLLSVSDIQHKPLTYSYIKEPVRRYKIESFPYKIFYILSEKTVFVLGVAHTKRSNAFIRKRLKLL